MIARLTARRTLRSAIPWGLVFGLYVTASSLGYASSYPTQASRDRLAFAFGANVGINAIIGSARHLNTVAGFTTWRSVGVLNLVGAVWGLLTATRLLRAEEDAGRWEVLLAGPTTRRRATAQAVCGLAVGLVGMFAVLAAIAIIVGRSTKVQFTLSSAVFLSVALVCSATMFLAIGVLTSQLGATRRQASGYAAGFLGVSYALRMVADSGAGLDWMRWASPLGWVEELRPLTGSLTLALLPIAGLTIVNAVFGVYLAGVRDLGASTLPDRDTAEPRTRLLTGPGGLAVRLIRGVVLAWGVAIAAAGVILGLISKPAGVAISTSSFGKTLARFGARGNGATAYLGLAFLVMALIVSLLAAGQIIAAREDEATGRLDNLLVRPVARTPWLAWRIVATALLLIFFGLLGGTFSFIGAASQNAGVGLRPLLSAGINLLPPAFVVLGAGVLAMGFRPRAVSSVTYGLIGWSFLVELIGGILQANHWLLDTSIFHHMATAPAVHPSWQTNSVLLAVGVGLSIVGGIGFARRDLAGA